MIKRLLSVEASYHFQQYISYISEVSLISVGNKRLPIYYKSLSNFITESCTMQYNKLYLESETIVTQILENF